STLQNLDVGGLNETGQLRQPHRRMLGQQRDHLLPTRASPQPSQSLQHRPIRFARAELFNTLPAPDPDGRFVSQAAQKNINQSSLANAGLARHKYKLTCTLLRPREAARQLRQFGLTPDHQVPLAQRFGAAGRRTPLARADRWTGRCGVCWGDFRYKAVALTIKRLDEPLIPSAVPNRLSHRFYRALNRRVTDELLWPELLTQLLLGDDSFGLCEQIGQGLK